MKSFTPRRRPAKPRWQLRIPLSDSQYVNFYRDFDSDMNPLVLSAFVEAVQRGLEARGTLTGHRSNPHARGAERFYAAGAAAGPGELKTRRALDSERPPVRTSRVTSTSRAVSLAERRFHRFADHVIRDQRELPGCAASLTAARPAARPRVRPSHRRPARSVPMRRSAPFACRPERGHHVLRIPAGGNAPHHVARLRQRLHLPREHRFVTRNRCSRRSERPDRC